MRRSSTRRMQRKTKRRTKTDLKDPEAGPEKLRSSMTTSNPIVSIAMMTLVTKEADHPAITQALQSDRFILLGDFDIGSH